MVDGVFPALVVAGLFLLVLAVVIGTVVIARRGRPTSSQSQRPPLTSNAAVTRSHQTSASQPDGSANEEIRLVSADRRTSGPRPRTVGPRPGLNRSWRPCGLRPTP